MFFLSPKNVGQKLFEIALSVTRLYPYEQTRNPYKRIKLPVLPPHNIQLEKLLQLLVHSMTLLNKTYREKDKNGYYISYRDDYVNALALMKDLIKTYHLERTSEQELVIIKLQSAFKNNVFKRPQAEEVLGYRKSMTLRILRGLIARGDLLVVKNKKCKGYHYQLKEPE